MTTRAPKETAADEAPLFGAIAREESLSSRVAAKLEATILEGKIPAGGRLPSERELGDNFGVSRTVIREAVRALSAKGLLEVRMGDGTYVLGATAESAAEGLRRLLRVSGAEGGEDADAAAIYEVRRPLEVAIAGLAAERADAAQLAELEACAEALAAPGISRERYVEADVRFHTLLAEATGNRLFVALLDSLGDLMGALREVGMTVGGAREAAHQHHRAIFQRIAARDAKGARRVMEAHMDASEEILRKAIARARPRPRR